MNKKLVAVGALVLGAVVVFVFGFTAAFLVMPRFAYAMMGQGNAPGYGYGMMGQDYAASNGCPMMGNYADPDNPSSDSPTSPVPGYGPGMMGRGGMMGGNNFPRGNTAPSAQSSVNTVQMNSSTATQKVGNLNVTIALNPYPPIGFQKTSFDVTLTDSEGQAITDAKIALDLTMPSMWMPPNKPQAQHVGNGKYSATGNFTMRGWWRIEVIITRGSQNQSAYFDLGI